jgi:hypothetical protein
VEIEVNGLMTYDREVVKMDLDRIAAAARKLYGPPPVVHDLVPTSEGQAQEWRYTFEEPDDAWSAADFDDAAWKSGPGGFGTRGTPGAVVRTEWNGRDVWLRRTFTLDSIPEGDLCLRMHHDEDVEVYVNGQRVASARGYTTSYVLTACEPGAEKALKQGENTLAVHCRQTGGGQYIDVGLQTMTEPGQASPEASAAR